MRYGALSLGYVARGTGHGAWGKGTGRLGISCQLAANFREETDFGAHTWSRELRSYLCPNR